MEIKRLVACISIFCLMFSSVASAQQIPMPEWARRLGGWWVISIVIAFILIAAGLLIRNRYVLGVGIIVLFISIVLIEVGVILPLLSTPTISYEQCEGMFKPDASIVTVPGLFYTTSCILTGYSPTNLEWLTITTFFIFGIIAPLALLISLFYEFVPEGMITNKNARNVIAVVGALFAFRGFFATFFINLLSYGFAGIGALLVGVLFTGYVWKAAMKFCMPLGMPPGEVLRTMALARVNRIKEEIREVEMSMNETQDLELKARLEKRLELLRKDLAKALADVK